MRISALCLRAAREAEDARIIDYVASLTPADLGGHDPLPHDQQSRRISSRSSRWRSLHVFNHQTHHRGQVHCLLTRITDEAPSLDLILYQRETGSA